MMNQFTASLWGDEAWAATLAIKPVGKIISLVARDTSPPFYYLILHFWLKIFGTSEVAIRSLSFLFFLGTVLTVYFIGKHLWDKKTGLWAALLTLVNPFLFQYAFEGRMYSLLVFTATLSVYFFLKKQRLGFILATLAALYTHHFALFIVFFETLWHFAQNWQKPKWEILKSFSSFAFVGLGYLPWIYPLYYQTSQVASGFWLGKPDFEAFKELVLKFVIGPQRGIWERASLWAILGVFLLRRWSKEKAKSIFLLGWFFIPLFLTFLISQIFQSIFFDRYMLMIIPAAPILLASQGRKLSLVFLVIIIFSLATVNWRYFLNPTKRPFRDLANFVKQQAPGLTRVNYNATAHHLFESKYYGIPAPIYAPTPLPFYTGTALMTKEDVIRTLPKKNEILLISSESPEKINLPPFKIEKSQNFDGLYLLWLQK